MHKPSMTRLLGPFVFVLTAAMLSACAVGPRSIPTDVTTFNEWSSLPAEKTYSFARTLQYQNSLEMKSYENIVRDELDLQGFKLVADAAQGNLLVTLRPSVTGTSLLVPDTWGGYDPFWGGPFGGFYGRGFYGRGFYGGGFGYPGPYWGYDHFDSSRVDVYHKSLELDIDSRTATGTRFYEGKVETTGRNGSLPQVMPVLIRALFIDFPGDNGQSRRVDVPVERAP